MRLLRDLTVVLLALACAPSVSAQGLAAAAAKEKERRAKQKSAATAKTYDSEQLGSVGTLANDTSIPPAEAGAAAGTQDAAAVAEAPARATASGDRGEAYWRSRAQQLRAAVTAAEAKLAEAEQAAARLGPARPGDYKVNCKDGRVVMSNGQLGPVTNACAGDNAIIDWRLQAQSRVESARQNLERARRALAGLEEEARVAGALPGWIR
jgi:hypothetical protein